MVSSNMGTGTLLDIDETLLRGVAEALQLPESTDSEARRKYDQVGLFLSQHNASIFLNNVFPQGSQSYGTTVKPIGREEFDLDVIVSTEWHGESPGELINKLADALKKCPYIEAEPEIRDRCVRVKFPGRMHMDFVPAIDNPHDSELILIPDKTANGWAWKATNPKGFTAWFEAQSLAPVTVSKMSAHEPLPDSESAQVKSDLKIVVQLLKRHHQRMYKGSDEYLRTPSIVLTTIAGHVGATGDVYETFESVLQMLEEVATWESGDIRNPAHDDEVVSEKWSDPEVYNAFRIWVRRLRQDAQEYAVARGSGVHNVNSVLSKMYGRDAALSATRKLGRVVQRSSKASGLRATEIGGGALSSVAAGRGARSKEFYGRPDWE